MSLGNGMNKFLYWGIHILVVVGGSLIALSNDYYLVRRRIERNYEWSDKYEKE